MYLMVVIETKETAHGRKTSFTVDFNVDGAADVAVSQLELEGW